jgi:uncharacterized protein (TIGR02145 family)
MNEWYQYEGSLWKKVVCGEKLYNPTDHFCDARDDGSATVYRMVTIGEGEKAQTWMAENMNYETENSFCYENNSEYCTTYGRLYTWDAANSVCPTGWHLPDTTEWKTLAMNVDPDFEGWVGLGDNSELKNIAGKILKAKSFRGSWSDSYHFSVLPAGKKYPYKVAFVYKGEYADFWSSTQKNLTESYNVWISADNDKLKRMEGVKDHGFSVRCIKNK